MSLLVACSGDGGQGADGGIGPDGEPDRPPEIRTLFVALEDDFSSVLDLTKDDRTRVLPAPVSATFRVYAVDGETMAEDLRVTVVGGDGTSLGGEPRLKNGIWEVDVMLEPGMVLHARVEDAGGHAAQSVHGLMLPTHAEGLSRSWKLRFYDTDQAVIEEWRSSFATDGSWSEEDPGGTSGERGGDYDINDGQVRVRERYGPGDGDSQTIESGEAGGYYLDDIYFAISPFARQSGGAGLEGRWTREFERYDAVSETWEQVSETLEMTAGTCSDGDPMWDGVFTETVAVDGATTVLEGCYRSVTADDYNAALGNFFHRKTISENEVSLAEPDIRFELYNLRSGQMLLSPRVQ